MYLACWIMASLRSVPRTLGLGKILGVILSMVGKNNILLMSGSTLPREVGDKVDGAQSRAAAHVQRPWERRRGKGEKLFSPSKRSLVALLEKVKHLSDNLAWMTRPGRLVLGSLADRRPDGRGCHGEGL